MKYTKKIKKTKKEILNKVKIITISKILQILQGGAEASILIFDALTSSKREGYRKLHNYEPGQYTGDNWGEIYKEKQKLYSALNRLKKDGLVEKNKNLWEITKDGTIKLHNLIKKSEQDTIKNNIIKTSKKIQNIIVVSYDIPRIYQKERKWVIEILKILGFQMAHQSVWIGKIKLPQEFFEELNKKGILKYFKIFEISKAGNLIEILK